MQNNIKSLGKKMRLGLFYQVYTTLKRMANATDTKYCSVFDEKHAFEPQRHQETVRLVKEAYQIYRQEDISHLKTVLYHLDPCPEKSNYKLYIAPICPWAEAEKHEYNIMRTSV